MNRLLLLAVMATGTCFAQNDLEPYMTGSLPNGRWWLLMDHNSKASFVMGCEESVIFAETMNEIDAKQPKRDEKMTAERRLYPIGATREETVKFLDQFFAAPENGRLWITQGIYVFAMKMRGKSAAEMEEWLRMTRMAVQ
jgi:hypothetical protein